KASTIPAPRHYRESSTIRVGQFLDDDYRNSTMGNATSLNQLDDLVGKGEDSLRDCQVSYRLVSRLTASSNRARQPVAESAPLNSKSRRLLPSTSLPCRSEADSDAARQQKVIPAAGVHDAGSRRGRIPVPQNRSPRTEPLIAPPVSCATTRRRTGS